MGVAQELRRDVRAELVGYAERHPHDFEAHMAASAVLWLLAGRQGLTQPQQFALVHQAEVTVARLTVGRSSHSLTRVQQQLVELVELLRRRKRSDSRDADLVSRHAEDFAEWTLELDGNEETGGGLPLP